MRVHSRRILALAALAALLFPAAALALPAGPLPSGGATTGLLTAIQQVFSTASGGWLTHATGAAQDLFRALALIEISWVAIQWALKRPELHELIGSLALKIMFFAVFYFGVIGMAPHWVPLLIHIFHRAGLIVTGAGSAPAGALSPSDPSAIFGESWTAIQGLEQLVHQHLSANPLYAGQDVLWGLCSAFAALVFFLAYALIAFEALLINIEASVILGAGVFMLAFAGSSWTTTFSEKYVSYVFSIGVKYFVLTVILVAGVHLPQYIQHVFTALGQDKGGGPFAPLAASMVTLVYGVTGLMAPGIAGSMLSGSPSLSTGSFMGAAAGGAGVAAAGLGAAAGVAGMAGSGAAGLAAMAKRLGGGASAVGGIAADMGAMGMLGSMAGKNGPAAGSGGGVAGLARATGSSSRGPVGSLGGGSGASAAGAARAGGGGSGARSGGPTGTAGRTGAWTVDSAGTARPGGPSPSGGTRPAGRSGTAAGGSAPNIRFGDRDGGSASRQAGAAGSGAAPGQGPANGLSGGSGAAGPTGGSSTGQAHPGQDRGADSNTGGPAGGTGPAGGGPAAGNVPPGTAAGSGQDGIADPKGTAPGAAAEGAGAEKAGKGFFSRTAAQHAANVAKHASRGIGHAQDALRHQGLSGGINIRLNHPE
jgi:type IV secretion system protein TrbL